MLVPKGPRSDIIESRTDPTEARHQPAPPGSVPPEPPQEHTILDPASPGAHHHRLPVSQRKRRRHKSGMRHACRRVYHLLACRRVLVRHWQGAVHHGTQKLFPDGQAGCHQPAGGRTGRQTGDRTGRTDRERTGRQNPGRSPQRFVTGAPQDDARRNRGYAGARNAGR